MAATLPLADDHLAVERLLPWYATAQLDDAERAAVEAHLAQCSACAASLAFEPRLKAAVARLSPQAATDWAALRERLDPPPARRPAWRDDPAARRTAWHGGRHAARRPLRIARLLAVPVASAVAAAALVLTVVSPDQPAPYRTLGTAPVAATGNVIVMFRPDVTEAGLRGVLRGSGARLIDGPTSANAYLLRVAEGRRAAALQSLRAQPAVTLAEPVDSAPAP